MKAHRVYVAAISHCVTQTISSPDEKDPRIEWSDISHVEVLSWDYSTSLNWFDVCKSTIVSNHICNIGVIEELYVAIIRVKGNPKELRIPLNFSIVIDGVVYFVVDICYG